MAFFIQNNEVQCSKKCIQTHICTKIIYIIHINNTLCTGNTGKCKGVEKNTFTFTILWHRLTMPCFYTQFSWFEPLSPVLVFPQEHPGHPVTQAHVFLETGFVTKPSWSAWTRFPTPSGKRCAGTPWWSWRYPVLRSQNPLKAVLLHLRRIELD